MRRVVAAIAVALLFGGCQPQRPLAVAADGSGDGAVSFPPALPLTVAGMRNLAEMPPPPASIPGTLRLPAGTERVAAVVILHATGGVDGRGAHYAAALRQAGIASLEVDMWAARGIDRRRAVAQRPRSTLHTLPDAYGALRFLAAHPRIDPDRIGVMGMSWGGIMSVRAARGAIQTAFAPQGPRFRAFAPLYPPCAFWTEGGIAAGELDRGWPEGPVLLLAAGREDYNFSHGPADCDGMMRRLPAAARQLVTLHLYPDATHGWDRQESPATVLFIDPTAAGGRGGQVTMTADPAATADSTRRVVAFFGASLAPR
jgi:dienelactone hydrolase